jgi:hypothetical protein
MDEELPVQVSKDPLVTASRGQAKPGEKTARSGTQAGEVNSREGEEGCRISDDHVSNFVTSCQFFQTTLGFPAPGTATPVPPTREKEATRGTVSEIHVGVFGVEWGNV